MKKITLMAPNYTIIGKYYLSKIELKTFMIDHNKYNGIFNKWQNFSHWHLLSNYFDGQDVYF